MHEFLIPFLRIISVYQSEFDMQCDSTSVRDLMRAMTICWTKRHRLLQKVEEYESKNTSGQPPPEHTRGKWVPGARTDIESGYWCNPCGRKLASRLVYNRHLLSDLHARRSIRELDGEALHLRRGINSHARVSRRVSTRKQTLLATVMISLTC